MLYNMMYDILIYFQSLSRTLRENLIIILILYSVMFEFKHTCVSQVYLYIVIV